MFNMKDPEGDMKMSITAAKVTLIRSYPFLGMLVMSCHYKVVEDEETVKTLAAYIDEVGNNYVLFNEKFWKSMDDSEQCAVILHEVLHIFLDHQGRASERGYHHRLFNVAADYVINYQIKQLNNGNVKLPEQTLYDPRFAEASADEVYHILLSEYENNAEKAAVSHGGGEGQEGQGAGKNGQGVLDDLGRVPVSKAAQMANKQRAAAAASDSSGSKDMGEGAAGILRMLKKILEPTINWKEALAEFVTTSARDRYTYARVSRRSTKEIIFPSLHGEHVKLVFGVDTSGSMSSKDLNEAYSELAGILDTFDSWEVDVISCDTSAHVHGQYASEEGDSLDSIDAKALGGGGTDMAPIVEYANELGDNDEEPAVCVIVTDGYIPEESVEHAINEVPVIIVVTRDGNSELNIDGANVLFMKDEG